MNTSYQRLTTKEQASFTELVEHREAIILDLESLHYYSLNPAATLLWKQLRSGAAVTVDELGGALAAAFGISPGQAAVDAAEFVAELRQCGLVADADGEVAKKGAAPELPPAALLGAYESPALKVSESLMQVQLSATSTVAGGS